MQPCTPRRKESRPRREPVTKDTLHRIPYSLTVSRLLNASQAPSTKRFSSAEEAIRALRGNTIVFENNYKSGGNVFMYFAADETYLHNRDNKPPPINSVKKW